MRKPSAFFAMALVIVGCFLAPEPGFSQQPQIVPQEAIQAVNTSESESGTMDNVGRVLFVPKIVDKNRYVF